MKIWAIAVLLFILKRREFAVRLAIAHAAGVELTLDDFEAIHAWVPVLCDLKPSGRDVATDLHKVGVIPQV